MDDIVATQRKLEAKYKSSNSIASVELAIESLQQLREQLETGLIDETAAQVVMGESVRALCKNLGDDQKEIYNVHAKHSKAIAKRFKADIASDPVQNVIHDEGPLIDQAIVLHLLRQGDFENAEAFAREASVARDDKLWDAFKVLYDITTSLSRGELSDAIAWARARREHLQQRRSSLEFNLHKAQYIRIYQTSHVFEAIKYAQQEFPAFGKTHMKEIQQLFAALTFHGNRDKSPYGYLFESPQPALREIFARDYLALLQLGVTPPIQTTVEAAAIALPSLIKLASLKVNKSTEEEATGSGVDIDLPTKFRHHSVFVCPVMRDVSATGFLLACGHVIGSEALQGLARGTNKLKCIYCPTLSNVAEARPLVF